MREKGSDNGLYKVVHELRHYGSNLFQERRTKITSSLCSRSYVWRVWVPLVSIEGGGGRSSTVEKGGVIKKGPPNNGTR